MSADRLRPLYLSRGEGDEAPKIADFLRTEGTSAPDLIVELLAALDVEATLPAAGLTEADLTALRRRLLLVG